MDKLRSALETVYLRELERFPSEEELETQITISPEFEERMRELFNGQTRHAAPKRMKRIVLAAVLAALMASAVSVQAIRGPVIRFFLDIQEECSRLIFNTEQTQPTAESKIFIPDPPEGYTETKREEYKNSVVVEYVSDEGFFLSYCQNRIKGLGKSLNTENADTDWEWINGFDVFVFTNKGFTSMVWSDSVSVYVYDITTNGEISELRDFAENIMEKIK